MLSNFPEQKTGESVTAPKLKFDRILTQGTRKTKTHDISTNSAVQNTEKYWRNIACTSQNELRSPERIKYIVFPFK